MMRIVVSTIVTMLVGLTPIRATPLVILLAHRAMVRELPVEAKLIVPEEVLRRKISNQVMSAARRDVFDRLTRYAVADLTQAQLQVLQQDGVVVQAQPLDILSIHDKTISNDSLSADQYGLHIVGAAAAWKLATGDGVRVGVIDTGIDWDHPDLKPRLLVNPQEDLNKNGTFEPWPSSQEIGGVSGDLDGVDQDGNGYVDDVIGFDFVDQTVNNVGDDRDRDAVPADEQGHGTSVSGVICAEADNGIGIAGLARGARVVTLRAFDATGNAEEDDIAAALVYAALNGVQVVNMSFGDGVDSPVLRDAITFAAESGCVLVSSAGNTGRVSRQYPAGYDQVIVVGSTNINDQRSVYSSTGSLLDLVAPGESIVTTAVGSRYRTVSGTSFSAPLVVAAAALLIEQRPEITAQQIQGVLTESSIDLGERGWDTEYGAGRLQVDAALTQVGEGEVCIEAPSNEQEVMMATGTQLAVTGSAYATLFDTYEIYVGTGVEPRSWTMVHQSPVAVIRGKLAVITPEQMTDGTNVLRLVVRLKSGRSLESRRRVHVVTSDTLRITQAEVTTAWKEDRRVGVLTISATRPVQLTLHRTPSNHLADTSIVDLRFTRTHCVVFDSDVWSNTGSISAVLRAGNGDTVRYTAQYDLGVDALPTTGFKAYDNGEFAGYVLDDVRDILGDGKQSFLMNDLAQGTFGPMTLMQRDGFNFVNVATTPDVWIPRGMGDANGNGLLEVFAHVVGKAVLFEQVTPTGSPFEKMIFADTLNGQNAAGMADIDGDGHEDLVMLSDSGCKVVAWRNGSWQEIGKVANTTPPAPGNADNRIDEISVATGDFDGDGRMEIAFADTDGDLIIAEYTGTGLERVYTYESDGVGGSGYVAGGDVNNDGKPDILFGVPDNPYLGDDGEYGRQLWTYHLFTSTADGVYAETWTDRVYGVRYGIGYRNGVGLGNVNDVNGAEVLICAFPRLFVFTWDQQRGMVPLLYHNEVVSPRFLTHDFDGNGIGELGFGTTTREVGLMTDFAFVSYQPLRDQLPTPAGLKATLLTPTHVRLKWSEVPGASGYRVFWNNDGSGLLRLLDTVYTNIMEIDTLATGFNYRFRVSAIPADINKKESERSNIVDVLTGTPHKVVLLTPQTLSASSLRTGAQFIVTYDGALPQMAPDPANFMLTQAQPAPVVRARSVTIGGDAELIVTFDPATEISPSMMLNAASFFDRIGVPTTPTQTLFTTIADTVRAELTLMRLDVISNAELHLTYSMAIGESALAIAPYTLSPSGTVVSIQRLDSNKVLLQLGTDPPLAALGATYALTVRNVQSVSGQPITHGTGSTLSFVLAQSNLDDVFVYPHPVSINNDGAVTFANLTADADVEVLDQRFKSVRKLHETGGNGGVGWDLRDASGQTVPPGMYFYRVTGSNLDGTSHDSGLRKIMIKR